MYRWVPSNTVSYINWWYTFSNILFDKWHIQCTMTAQFVKFAYYICVMCVLEPCIGIFLKEIDKCFESGDYFAILYNITVLKINILNIFTLKRIFWNRAVFLKNIMFVIQHTYYIVHSCIYGELKLVAIHVYIKSGISTLCILSLAHISQNLKYTSFPAIF